MSTVSTDITPPPDAPKEGNTFRTQAAAWVAAWPKTIADLKTFITQLATVKAEIDAAAESVRADEVINAASTATAKAAEASLSATIAGQAKTETLAARDRAIEAAATAIAGGIAKPAGAAKGDIVTFDAAGNSVRVPAGAPGQTLGVGDDGLPFFGGVAVVATPALYARDILGGVAGYTVAAGRRTLLTPSRLAINVNDSELALAGQQALDLNAAASWDSTATDYTVPANRAGKDFYRYAVNNGGALKILLSANSTIPTGYTAATSRKIGGCHCVPLSYGAISGHALTGFVTGDILPGSVWDLMHLPRCSPEGMTYNAGLRLWRDIYGNSYSGGRLVSVLGGVLVDGTSTPAYQWLKACQHLGAIGKRLPWYHEVLCYSLGANQGTNISGSADPGVAGAFVDTAGRRMVAHDGGEMDNGVMWWWTLDMASAGPQSWRNGFDGNDSSVGGQVYMEPNRGIVGGGWSNAALCGSRALSANNGPLALASNFGVRGVAEPLAVAL